MEKSCKGEPEGTVQDSGIFQEQTVDSDDLQSNQQLLKSGGQAQNEASELGVTHETQKLLQQERESTENLPAQDSLQKPETDGTSSQECRELAEDEGLEQEIVVNVIVRQKVERSVESCLAPAQDTIHQDADEGTRQECVVFAEVEQLEPERNATLQQRAESPGEVLIAPTSDSIGKAEHGANYATQECDGNAHLEANAAQQQEIETSTILFNLNPKSGQSCEVSEDNVKVTEEQEIVTQESSKSPEEVSEIRAEPGTKDDGASVREQLLLNMIGNFFNQQPRVIEQQMEISHQENTHSLDHSDKIKPRQLEETTTSGESEDHLCACPQDLHPEIEEDTQLKHGVTSLARDHESSHPSNGFATFQRGEPEDATVCHRKIKDYVTFPPRESDDATICPQDHETRIPQTSDDYALLSSQWKDYVTLHPAGRNVRMPPRPAPEITKPSTHIFWRARLFNEIVHHPKIPTSVFWPLQRFPETASDSESEKPYPALLPTGRLGRGRRKGTSPPLPSGTRSNQARTPQYQGRTSTADDGLPLMAFEEEPEAAVGTEEPRVQRDGGVLGALLPSLPTGIRDCVKRIRERRILFMILKILFYGLLFGSIFISAFYFTVTTVMRKVHAGGSNLTSYGNEMFFMTNMSIKVTDFDFGGTTPVNVFNFGITTPVHNFNYGVTTAMNYFNFGVTTPVTDFDFGVNAPVTDFNLGVTTPVTYFDLGVTTPVTDFNLGVTTPVTDFNLGVTTPVNYIFFNITSPVKDC